MASQDPLTALGSPLGWAITRARSRADWALLARISNPYQRLLVAALAGINVVALAPFALWHLVLGRMLLGLITLLATAILAGLAFWVRRSYYVPWFAVLIV
ncbi:MAG: hypothetical protein BRD57_00555 [Proteobacteria bacterium SW_6_67_9]|nr:MAG: hypothetical protein BRD57_00555 [Proteobacteria bacterium SW_6_67_9]